MSTPTPRGISNHMVVRLLKRDMPRMQPSALKHEYLTSVANVLRNAVAHEVEEPSGTIHAIGFGDLHRTLPLHLVVETDGSVRHAFVPSVRDERQRRLLHALQEHENQWATERGATPRNIISQITHRGRGDVNRHGINHYEAGPPFTRKDLDAIATGRWYPTGPLPEQLEIDHQGRPELHEGLDGAKISTNLSRSATVTNSVRPDRPNLHVRLDPNHERRLRLARLEVEEPTQLDNDPEYE